MIRIILPTCFILPITDFYANSYDRYLNRMRRGELWADEKKRRYTRSMYRANSIKVLSVNGKILERLDHSNGTLSTYAPWASLGYHSFCYEHWYFAYDYPFIAPDGRTYVEIKDIKYDGEYHNDTMDEPVYLETKIGNKMIINEQQLRSIIREALTRILFAS